MRRCESVTAVDGRLYVLQLDYVTVFDLSTGEILAAGVDVDRIRGMLSDSTYSVGGCKTITSDGAGRPVLVEIGAAFAHVYDVTAGQASPFFAYRGGFRFNADADPFPCPDCGYLMGAVVRADSLKFYYRPRGSLVAGSGDYRSRAHGAMGVTTVDPSLDNNPRHTAMSGDTTFLEASTRTLEQIHYGTFVDRLTYTDGGFAIEEVHARFEEDAGGYERITQLIGASDGNVIAIHEDRRDSTSVIRTRFPDGTLLETSALPVPPTASEYRVRAALYHRGALYYTLSDYDGGYDTCRHWVCRRSDDGAFAFRRLEAGLFLPPFQ